MLEQPVSSMMCADPRTINIGEKAVDAMSAMETPRKITFLPVTLDDNVLVGLVTLHGLVSAGL